MREKSASINFATSFASNVLATPGTPSIRTCPFASMVVRIKSTGPVLPHNSLRNTAFKFSDLFRKLSQVYPARCFFHNLLFIGISYNFIHSVNIIFQGLFINRRFIVQKLQVSQHFVNLFRLHSCFIR